MCSVLQQDTILPKNKREVTLFKSLDQMGEWVEDNRRVFFQQFKGGLNQTYVQMIPLNRFDHYQVWLFCMFLFLNSIKIHLTIPNSSSMSKLLTSTLTIGFSVAMQQIFTSTNDIGEVFFEKSIFYRFHV